MPEAEDRLSAAVAAGALPARARIATCFSRSWRSRASSSRPRRLRSRCLTPTPTSWSSRPSPARAPTRSWDRASPPPRASLVGSSARASPSFSTRSARTRASRGRPPRARATCRRRSLPCRSFAATGCSGRSRCSTAPTTRVFGLEEMELLELFADQAAIALDIVQSARGAARVLEGSGDLAVVSRLAAALDGLEGERREAAVGCSSR